MKFIHLTSRTEEDWGGKFVDETNFDELLNESAFVFKPDGSLLLALYKSGHSKESIAQAWEMLKDYNPSSNNRGLASGSERRKRVRKDGSVSNVNIADEVASGVVGYFERSPRFPYCRAAAWNLENPEKFSLLFKLCGEASAMYESSGAEKYEKQHEHAVRTHPNFMIPGTVFSSLTVNKNFRTACHKDAGNLKDTLNVMSLFREGLYKGGDIVFPDFRVAAKLETGDCIVFDAHEFHGNTPIFQISKKYTRCTIVFYYRENMDQCGSAEVELERAKRRQLGQPLFDKESSDAQ